MTQTEISERVSGIIAEANTLLSDIIDLVSELADMLVNNNYEIPDLDDDNG